MQKQCHSIIEVSLIGFFGCSRVMACLFDVMPCIRLGVEDEIWAWSVDLTIIELKDDITVSRLTMTMDQQVVLR